MFKCVVNNYSDPRQCDFLYSRMLRQFTAHIFLHVNGNYVLIYLLIALATLFISYRQNWMV